jgi:hypothetical protein
MGSLLPIIVLAILVFVAIGPIWFWARRIEKRIGSPPDRPGHEEERFHFKYGAEPPGDGGGGTFTGVG